MIKKILLAVVALYLIVGFFVVPLLKPQLKEALEQNLLLKAQIGKLSFNPLSFEVTIQQLNLYDKQTDTKFFGIDRFVLNLDPIYLFIGKLKIASIKLHKPYVAVEIDKNKQLNVTKIIPSSSKKKKETSTQMNFPLNIVLGDFLLDGGVVQYKDFSKKTPYIFDIERIKLVLRDLSYPTQDHDGYGSFFAQIGLGGFIYTTVAIHNLKTLNCDGTIEINANQLYNQWRYVKDNLNIEVADGKLSLNGDFHYDQNQLSKTGINNLVVTLEKLRIKPKKEYHDILHLKKFALKNGAIYPFKQEVHIQEITLDSLDVIAKRFQNGFINWQDYIKTSFPSSKDDNVTTKKSSSSQPWNLVVDSVFLHHINGKFFDQFVQPTVITSLDNLDIKVKDFQLNSKKPFDLFVDMTLNDTLHCQSNANVIQNPLYTTATLYCNGFDITHYNPYIIKSAKKSLKRFDVDIQKAILDINTNIAFKQQSKDFIIDVKDTNVVLKDLTLAKKSTKRKFLYVPSFQVQQLQLNTKTKELQIKKIVVDKLHLYPKRYKNKKINLATLVVPKNFHHRKKKNNISSSKDAPYHIHINEFGLINNYISFYDKALLKPTITRLRNITLKAYDIDSKKYSKFRYKFYTRINHKGKLSLYGKIRHTPLQVYSKLDLKSLTLKDFSNYLSEHLNATIEDGILTTKAKIQYQHRKKDPDLVVKSDINLDSFALAPLDQQGYIFYLSQLGINDAQLELMPNRAYINTVNIDGLYVDAFINEKKILNLSQLLKQQPKKQQSFKELSQKKEEEKPPFPFQVAHIKVENSNASFADFSLPIKFKTEIRQLHGDIYAISNQKDEISYIDLKGGIDKYGSMKLKGSLQSANVKNYTDIAMNFRNLDLHSLSGYSAEFAGYEIAKGKLFVDLAYKIKAGEMKGENNIIIKNIELGKEIDDENVTHLPLALAIALLEDNDGMIDISMPVEGDVNNPDFKYGHLIVKTFANLIIKAVAAPFKFLGAALGINAEELEYINFEAGSAILLPSEIEKLDKLTKMLIKRPKIKVIFTPTYEVHLDSYGLKKQLLIKQLLAASEIKSEKDFQNAMTIELLEELYTKKHPKEVLERYHKQLEKEYKNDDIVAIEYQKALIQKVIKDVVLPKGSLEKLARKRVEMIKQYLINDKGIDPNRIGEKQEVEVLQEDAKKEIPLKVDIAIK